MTTAIANDRLQKRFDRWDADGNGTLERRDLEAEANRIIGNLGKSSDSPEGQALKDAFDGLFDYLAGEAGIGGDGSLAKDVFLRISGNLIFQAGEASFNRALGPVVKAVVGLCDKNGDGLINATEFQAWLTGVGVTVDDAKDAFRKVDTDGDGELSLDELLTAVREYHFGRLEVELLG